MMPERSTVLCAYRLSPGNGFRLRVQQDLTVPLLSTGRRTTRRAGTTRTLGEAVSAETVTTMLHCR